MATLVNDKTITSAGLAPVPTVQTVPQPVDTVNYPAITGGVTESIISDYTNLNNRLNTAQQGQNGTAQSILDAMNELTGKTADTQTANEQSGVNTETANLNKYAQQLADLNAQATSLNREAQAIPLQVQEQNRNTGATDRGVAPQEAGALRLNALRALSIGQQSDIAAAAATGSQLRLQAAKDKAQQMVDLKYKPLEEALAIKQKQYELNKDILTSIDKKRTEALTTALAKEAKELEEAKAREKAVQDILTTAGIQEAPADLLARAKNAKTPSEAAMILGQYAGDFYKTELLKQQIAIEKAQRSKIYADMDTAAKAAQTPEVEAWVNNITNGKAKLSDVPAKLKSLVSIGLASAQAKTDPTVIQSSLNELDTLEKLRTDDLAIKGLSGTLTVGPFNVLYTSRLNDWKANMDNMLSKLTVTELARVKNTGVTFGALSEGERQAVAAAASALNSAKQYEGDGENRRWTGKFNASEQFVRDNIKKIQDLAEIDFQKRTGVPSSQLRQPTNEFSQSLGKTNQTVPGTSIINKVEDDGSIVFKIPTTTPITK